MLSFPAEPDEVLKKSIPLDAVDDPFKVQYFIVLLDASLINLTVEVPVAFEVLVFEITKSWVDPEALTLPSIVTFCAPFKSIKGEDKLPLIE